MSRTVTALYDTRAEAQAAQQRLAAEVDLGDARILDQQSHAAGGPDGSLDRVAVSHEDRPAFGEGLRRGGFMLTAQVRGHEDADKIIALLDTTGSVDLDQRQEQWRAEGWSPQAPEPKPAERAIPVVEEALAVGKREVERGGARVRSYVREVPVHEEVTLRDEHVSVERVPVNQPVAADALEGSDLLRERDVELVATGEEAVVSKEAHMREEVVVHKVAQQHVERIDETVARTEIEIEAGPGSAGDGPADILPESEGAIDMADNSRTGNGRDLPITPTPVTEAGRAPGTQPPLRGTPAPAPATAPVPAPAPLADTRTIRDMPRGARPSPHAGGRQLNRPSAALVIGSAVAGAIAGGVIPFMLAGRKPAVSREILLIEDKTGETADADLPGARPGHLRSV